MEAELKKITLADMLLQLNELPTTLPDMQYPETIPDEQIDTSDIPELTEEDFARGHFKYWKPTKKSITIRIDVDLLAWIQSPGKKDYQARLNSALRWAKMNNCPVSKF